MKQLIFGRWRLCCDREATRRAYDCIKIGGPEACGCCYCRNFAADRSQIYPAEVRALFDGLGIDFTKESEVYEMGRLESGLRQYGGWFHCVGRIEAEGEEIEKFDLEGGTGPFSFYFHDKPNLVPACFQGSPLLQLEFNAQVPWVLQEPEPDGV
jgi:hypothetical protein